MTVLEGQPVPGPEGSGGPSSEEGCLPLSAPRPFFLSFNSVSLTQKQAHTTMHRAPTTFIASAAKRVSAVSVAFTPRVSSQSPLLIRSLLAHHQQQHATAMVATTPFRGYASKKDNKGGKGVKGGKKNSKDEDDEEDSGSRKGKGKGASSAASTGEMTFDPLDLEKKFSQCLERLKRDFTTMRAGTANPGKKTRH